MTCNRCQGVLRKDPMFDLPRGFVELYCMNCGERIWVDITRFSWAVKLN